MSPDYGNLTEGVNRARNEYHARERRYALLQSATILHASLSGGEPGTERYLTTHDNVPFCVDRAESLLAEIEKREQASSEAVKCEAIGSGE